MDGACDPSRCCFLFRKCSLDHYDGFTRAPFSVQFWHTSPPPLLFPPLPPFLSPQRRAAKFSFSELAPQNWLKNRQRGFFAMTVYSDRWKPEVCHRPMRSGVGPVGPGWGPCGSYFSQGRLKGFLVSQAKCESLQVPVCRFYTTPFGLNMLIQGRCTWGDQAEETLPLTL